MLLPGLGGGTVREIDVRSRDAGGGDASIETGPVTGTEIFKRYASRTTLALSKYKVLVFQKIKIFQFSCIQTRHRWVSMQQSIHKYRED